MLARFLESLRFAKGDVETRQARIHGRRRARALGVPRPTEADPTRRAPEGDVLAIDEVVEISIAAAAPEAQVVRSAERMHVDSE